ncbi:MAG: proline/glycine betaine ABC transporter permease [Desulfobacterium sp.]|jgi:glycine betaine/proline transport system permease protein|nr:proline/glycine betaine ABC transporter permease [Desulfobacterium sp.]
MYKIPVGDVIEGSINFLVDNFSFITKWISTVTEAGIDILVSSFMFFNPMVLILIISAGAWYATRKRGYGLGVFSLIGLLLIWNMGLWEPTMSTIALVLIATLVSIMIGVPLGIMAALNRTFYTIIMPILDFMQTMPAFVYLIPAIPFFGLGPVAAIFSTVIFSVPPAIRLTSLGIHQVPTELVEAADAFACTKWQKLIKLQIPIATPTIMAGINQTIMLALSMVVIAAMIGARGLGGEVWKAIQRLQPGRGFEAGLGIVIVAIILDRVMQQFGEQKQ